MSSESRVWKRLWVLVVASSVVGCADFRRGAYWDDVDDDDGNGVTGEAEGELSFESDVHPLLVDGCQSCHEPGALDYVVSDDVDETYQATVAIVDLDRPDDSRLLVKTRGDGHGGGSVYDRASDEYAVILSWIREGAVP